MAASSTAFVLAMSAEDPRGLLDASLANLESKEINFIKTTASVPTSPCAIGLPPTSPKDVDLLKQSVSPDKAVVHNAIDSLAERVLTSIDENGNTLLHLAVLNHPPAMVQLILEKLGDNAHALCQTVNFRGETPISLAHDIEDVYFRSKIINVLLPQTLDHSIQSFSTLINPRKILEKFPQVLTNPVLEENIMIGCLAINQSRNSIKFSATHMDSNYQTTEEKNRILDAIQNLYRETINKEFNLHDYRALIKKHGVANCGELAHLVFANILDMKMDKEIKIEMTSIQNGDHSFIILDRAEESDINDFTTWGPSAVYVDAWSGKVIPVQSKEFLEALKAFCFIGYNNDPSSYYNLLIKFNAAYHVLQVTQEEVVDMNGSSAFDVAINFSSTVSQEEKEEDDELDFNFVDVESSGVAENALPLEPSVLATLRPMP